jgi:uncharacterized membrane protein YhhN
MAALAVLLLTTAFAAGAAHLWARAHRRTWLAFGFKAVPILLFLALVLLSGPVVWPGYRTLVVVALLLSAAGDLLLAWPRDAFLPGLLAFLAAHIAYILAFLGVPAPLAARLILWPALLLALYGAGVLVALWSHVTGRLRLPVIVYVVVILAMAWQAAALCLAIPAPWTLLAFAAALCFVTSDSALAFNKFRGAFEGGDAVVMLTYYAAQMLFALSVVALK